METNRIDSILEEVAEEISKESEEKKESTDSKQETTQVVSKETLDAYNQSLEYVATLGIVIIFILGIIAGLLSANIMWRQVK